MSARLLAARLGLSVAGMLALGSHDASAATVTFNGTTSSELTTAANYSTGALPASGDTLQFNGTAAANPLTYTTATSGTLGGAAGITFAVTAAQTGALNIVTGQTGSNTIAIRLGTAALTVAAGSGAVTFGNGGTNILPLSFGAAASTQTFTNANAAGGSAVTFNSDVSFVPGGAAAHVGNFAGTGDFVLNNTITNTGVGSGGTLAFSATGTGTVFFNGANSTFTGVTGTNNGVTIGAANGTSVVRATATQALGTGAVGILGNGGAGQTSSNRLELVNGISLNNAFVVSGKTAATTGASIQNITGNNTLSGVLTATSGGNFYLIQSDAGTLTISNAASFSLGALTGTRTLTLQGAGNGVISGALSNGTSTGILPLAKAGTGTWTLNGASAYSGGTTVNGGTLVAGVNGALGAGNASVLATAVSLGIATGVTNPFANTTATLTLAGGGTAGVADNGFLDLTSGANITLASNSLILGATVEPDGVYSATSFPEYFLGTGMVTVGAVPEPGTWVMLLGGAAGLAAWLRRKRATA